MDFISIIWNSIILGPMANILIVIYQFLFHNYGLAIIIFTILIRLVTYPLTTKQLQSQHKMQELQNSKEWQAIQKKYKDDREKLAQEQMKIYQQMGISPFGSCLPLLIQFPIMIGLYQAITLAMASAPIQLLNLKTHLYSFLPASALIPLNSNFLWLNLGLPEVQSPKALVIFGFAVPILTVIVVVTTWFQSKVMTPPPANPNDQSAQMSKMMNLYMPILMGWIAYSLASGLAIYFIISNLLGIAQYAMMGKANWANLFGSKKIVPAKK